MPPDTSKMLHKIKALLAKAEANGTTPQEAESLSAKAAELMAKYSINVAMVDAARSKEDWERPVHQVIDVFGEPYALHKISLLHVIAVNGRCDGYKDGWNTWYTIFGFRSDLDLALTLYYSLLVQAQRALALAPVPAGKAARSFRVAWWIGYTDRLSKRLRQAKAQAEAEAPGTAVVLADRSIAVRTFKEIIAPPLGKSRRRYYQAETGGYAAGMRAADQAEIGNPTIDSRQAEGRLPEKIAPQL